MAREAKAAPLAPSAVERRFVRRGIYNLAEVGSINSTNSSDSGSNHSIAEINNDTGVLQQQLVSKSDSCRARCRVVEIAVALRRLGLPPRVLLQALLYHVLARRLQGRVQDPRGDAPESKGEADHQAGVRSVSG